MFNKKILFAGGAIIAVIFLALVGTRFLVIADFDNIRVTDESGKVLASTSADTIDLGEIIPQTLKFELRSSRTIIQGGQAVAFLDTSDNNIAIAPECSSGVCTFSVAIPKEASQLQVGISNFPLTACFTNSKETYNKYFLTGLYPTREQYLNEIKQQQPDGTCPALKSDKLEWADGTWIGKLQSTYIPDEAGKIARDLLRVNVIFKTSEKIIEPPPKACPTVCVPLWTNRNGRCELNQCGSGCGADNQNTFNSKAECLSSLPTCVPTDIVSCPTGNLPPKPSTETLTSAFTNFFSQIWESVKSALGLAVVGAGGMAYNGDTIIHTFSLVNSKGVSLPDTNILDNTASYLYFGWAVLNPSGQVIYQPSPIEINNVLATGASTQQQITYIVSDLPAGKYTIVGTLLNFPATTTDGTNWVYGDAEEVSKQAINFEVKVTTGTPPRPPTTLVSSSFGNVFARLWSWIRSLFGWI